MQLIPIPPGKIASGQVLFEGQDLLQFEKNGPAMRGIRGGEIAMIFQEPMTSLNPTMTIGRQLSEAMELHLGLDGQASREKAIELLGMVGIPAAEERLEDYPHNFSGGMRQRVMIAMALSCNPRLLIADEPTTALDVTIQAQILELMKDMVERFQASLVIVTHNLGVVARYADRIYVMYAGRIVEAGPTKEIFGNPRHPYTMALLKAVPRLDEERGRKLVPIVGLPPNLIQMPPTCAFLPRCPYSLERCAREPWPELAPVGVGHTVACYAERLQLDSTEISVAARNVQAAQARASEAPVEQERKVTVSDDDLVLDVKDLKMYFPILRGITRRQVGEVKALDGISFTVRRGETLGLVGESGCGKTTTGRCVLRLYEPTAGEVWFEGQEIASLPERKIKPLRRKMSLVFQDPAGSLDPRQTAGSIVGEPLKIQNLVSSRAEYRDRVDYLFRTVGLEPSMQDRVPHEFSGGQRQRLAVARALACDPSLIVCDEPISALDVSIQAQIINLLQDLQEKLGLTYLFVAHDLSVVRHISDRIAVMYLGRIVEIADAETLYEDPKHSYTKALLSAVPIPDPFTEETRTRLMLKGEVPSPLDPPTGCGFHPRCPNCTDECRVSVPELQEVGISTSHQVACLRYYAH
ncbi:MAG: dipeptide ABC transporter ATP-binding protein [Anaerolineae bacterium]|nr:dipeptide ABC transporter ATP-binding protein [Anaerolineae bacterium]